MMPTTATGSPTGVSSNIFSGACPEASSRPETTMLVDVPIKVITPPSSVAKESGIRKRDGETLFRAAEDARDERLDGAGPFDGGSENVQRGNNDRRAIAET